ncbi:hypothetical protein RhiirB3_434164 [Rhizophagus irregularis]|nr:hypothetical protein RhiirB3_434164 [Rhizophagus irregularis]
MTQNELTQPPFVYGKAKNLGHNLPKYSQMHNEISIQTAFEQNICVVLNKLLKDYYFSRELTKTPEDIGEQSFIEFHKHNSKHRVHWFLCRPGDDEENSELL